MWYKKAFQSSSFWNLDSSNDPDSLESAFIGVIEDSKTRTSNPKDIHQNLKAYKQELLDETPENKNLIDQAFELALDKLKSEYPDFDENKTSVSGNWVEEAKSWIGTPYVFGGDDRKGIDCSAFVQKVFESDNVKLPRTTTEQINVGQEIDIDDELQSGDRLYFAFGRLGKGNADHTGIYLGNNQFIQSSSSKGVTISDISDGSYYKNALMAVRR